MLNFQINIVHSLPILVILFLILIVFTLFIYKRTNPPIPPFLKTILIISRYIVLFTLVLLLAEPTIHTFFSKKLPPVFAVLLDNSASMNIENDQGLGSKQVINLLKTDFFNKLGANYKFKYYTFSGANTLKEYTKNDTLTFTGDETDLKTNLEQAKAELIQENLNGIFLITDGNYTSGGNPVRVAPELEVPIYTIGVGSEKQSPDISIVDLEVNNFAYIGESTPVYVTIHNNGIKNVTVPVILKSENKTIITKNITFTSFPSEIKLKLDYTPQQVGRQQLTVEIPKLLQEKNEKNNKKNFYLDILKSKLQITIIAGSINAETSFLKRHLSNNKRYKIYSFQNTKSNFYNFNEYNKLENTDIFIFLDFPTFQTNSEFIKNILEQLQKNKSSILFISGKNVNPEKLLLFKDFLPFSSIVKQRNERLVYTQLTAVGEQHQVMQLGENSSKMNFIWQQLPPIFSNHVYQKWPDSELLAELKTFSSQNVSLNAKDTDKAPFILTRSSINKSAAVLAYPTWRWDLMLWGINNNSDFYNKLYNNLVRSLENQKSTKSVYIETNKSSYKFGEPVQVKVKVYDNNRSPVESAYVKAEITTEKDNLTIIATEKEPGDYEIKYQPQKPGDYKIEITANKNDQLIGKNSTLFTVGNYNNELNNTQLLSLILKQLSQTTNGSYTHIDSVNSLQSQITGKVEKITIENEFILRDKTLVLVFILLLLSLEWFIRKQKGML